jgi:hypothetical protein
MADGFATSSPVMTFQDASGQIYGRYIIQEAVPQLAYVAKQVTERVWVPKTVTENKTVSQVQYTPVYSYQPQLRNVYGWNPFASPQQVWQYVPIVQYQPSYTQVVQPVSYVRYEEAEVTKVVPELQMQSRPVGKFVDRPLSSTPNGGNMLAFNASTYSSPIGVANGNAFIANPNQQAALIAQANRSGAALPTRPIDYPVSSQSPLGQNLVAQAPAPYYVPTGASNLVNPNAATSSIALSNPAYASNALAYQNYGPMNPVTPTYPTVAARPTFQWPTFTNGTGSLFSTSFFNQPRSPSYVASNVPLGQSSAWTSNASPVGFRPNTSPYVTPTTSWGMPPSTGYRDPMQGGMQPTELR